jgi:hypothetical protein
VTKVITKKEKALVNGGEWDRRSLLRGAAVLAGATATAPLLGGAATAQAGSGDADALFKTGKFEQAGRVYEEILVVALNIGGTGEQIAGISEETAKQLGVRIDYDRALASFAGGQPVVAYPCYPKEVRLGDATAKGTYCYAGGENTLGHEGFYKLADFAHAFHKPYNITLVIRPNRPRWLARCRRNEASASEVGTPLGGAGWALSVGGCATAAIGTPLPSAVG